MNLYILYIFERSSTIKHEIKTDATRVKNTAKMASLLVRATLVFLRSINIHCKVIDLKSARWRESVLPQYSPPSQTRVIRNDLGNAHAVRSEWSDLEVSLLIPKWPDFQVELSKLVVEWKVVRWLVVRQAGRLVLVCLLLHCLDHLATVL